MTELLEAVYSFPPLLGINPRLLILGSMPGVASLQAQQYYAHPRNQFWAIMGELVGASPNLNYAERCEKLTQAGIALWDVLKTCRRQGSLDSNIQTDSILCNDIGGLLLQQPQLEYIFCNGTAAAETFRKQIQPGLNYHPVLVTRLPSTSPAHASLNFEQKLAIWREALTGLLLEY